MPQSGHRSGRSLVTSGCIGQAYVTGPPDGAAISPISATSARVLSGGAASQASNCCRSATSSGALRGVSNASADDEGPPASATTTDASE